MHVASIIVASVVTLGAVDGARADEWFVLAEKPIKAADQGVEIESEGGRWAKDIKQTKLSARHDHGARPPEPS
jgi:hypothetical protein